MGKLFAVIDPRSICEASGLRRLVTGEAQGLEIEVVEVIDAGNPVQKRYIPVDETVRVMYPVIQVCFINHLIWRY